MLGRKMSEATRKKMSESATGKIRSLETRKKMSVASKLKRHTEESKRKISIGGIGKHLGKENGNWKGGVSKNPNYRRIYRKRLAEGSHTFGEWELLKKQYGFTCPACGSKEPEIKLTEDHIVPLIKGGSDFIENIQPLCKMCNNKKFTKIIKY